MKFNIQASMTVALLVVMMSIVGVSHASAATIYINSSTGNDSTGDGSVGSPYQTFDKGFTVANTSGDTLDLTGTFDWSNPSETGDHIDSGYVIDKDITIQGQSATTTFIQASSTANTADKSVFTINTGNTVTIKNLTIRYGVTTLGSTGGGITNGGTLIVENSKIEYNTFNTTSYQGGGAIFSGNGTSVTISTSTISNNAYIGRLYGAGGVDIEANGSSLTIVDSTFANNSGTSDQPTAYPYDYSSVAGALEIRAGSGLTITNSTFTGNTTNSYAGAINIQSTNTIITNATIVGNNADAGAGGILFTSNSANLYLKNTILANNIGSTTPDDFYAFDSTSGNHIGDNGFNIVEASTNRDWSAIGDLAGDQVNLNIASSLADNGSINGVQTLALQAGSVAINAGNLYFANSGVSIPTLDQRGFSRSGAVDIGAYEYNGVLSPVFTGSGTGTSTDPYVITTCDQLEQMNLDLNASYVLSNDVDCSITNPNDPSNTTSQWSDGKGFSPIGGFSFIAQYAWQGYSYQNFTGSLDGQGHKILNLYINRPFIDSNTNPEGYYVGLFSTIANGAQVKNLGLVNVNVTGGNDVGALAGGLSGTATNVYSTGSVNGGTRVGGLVGVHVDANNFPNSSPLIYSWNGTKYTYTDDVGAILPKTLNGVDVATIKSSDVAPKDGTYSFKIAEEYNEIVYYDETALMTFDHAPGYSVVEPLNTGAGVADLRTISDTPTHPLISCTDDTGADCLNALRSDDDKWSYSNPNGTYSKKNLNKYWILDFGDLGNATDTELVLSGARDYAASAQYPGNSNRSIQVKDTHGNWVEIYNKAALGSNGSPRIRTVNMTGKFLSNDHHIKVAFDTYNANYFAIDTSPQVPFTTHTYHPLTANLDFHGFTEIDHTYYFNHNYDKVSAVPNTPFKNQYGNFTKYGDVNPLLSSSDDHFVIMRYGDQLSLEFPYNPIPEGMVRSFAVYNNALYKHATNDNLGVLGQSAGYLPYSGMTKYSLNMTPYPQTQSNIDYQNTWNTRFYPGPFPDALRSLGSTIIASYSTATTTGNYEVGGLVGENSKEIRRSYSSGIVTGQYYYAGGLVGMNLNATGWIHDSYSTGEVHGMSQTGGLAGYNSGTIERSYSIGDVYSTNSYTGGLIGLNYPATDPSVVDSFTTSNIVSSGNDSHGGLVGYGYSYDYASSSNYWFNSETDGIGFTQGTQPLKADSADVFKLNDTNVPLTDWDFSTIWTAIDGVNGGYPVFLWQHPTPLSVPAPPAPVVTQSSSGGSVSVATLAGMLAPGATTTAYLKSRGYDVHTQSSQTPSVGNSSGFSRSLTLGDTHPSVLLLQQYLNTHGFIITKSGPGSPGNETTKFGKMTFNALKKFQKAYKLPVTGFFGPKTRAAVLWSEY
ncbi:MAG: choice-of-anchor Q domain-containing protein [Candidatus Taylorbacteria bacterium]